MNMLFIQGLDGLHINEAYLELYRDIIRKIRKDLCANRSVTRKTIMVTIDRLIERVVHAKELLLKGDIEEEDFLVLKKDCESRIHATGSELQQSDWIEKKKTKSLNRVVSKLSTIGTTFFDMKLSEKRQVMRTLLGTHPVMLRELVLNDIASPGIRQLFALASDANCNPTQLCYTGSVDWNETERDRFISQIRAIGDKEKSSIGKRPASEILAFLTVFAKITGGNVDNNF